MWLRAAGNHERSAASDFGNSSCESLKCDCKESSGTFYFFKITFSTCPAQRSGSRTRHKAFNPTEPIMSAVYRDVVRSFCCALLSLRLAVAKPDAAHFSTQH